MIKWVQVAMLAAAFLVAPVRASTSTTDISGMWWNPAESGWGVNVTLQNDLAFFTFYVYTPGRAPVWYTGQAFYRGVVGAGDLLWDGTLYESQGPWFGGTFNASTVSTTQAGTVSFQASTITQATLNFSVNGVTVTKAVERFTFRQENYSGIYAGGYSLRATGCNPSSLNGLEEEAGTILVTHKGGAFSATLTGSGASCSFSGAYTQSGKLGAVDGNFVCSDGTQGTFSMYEITPTISGFNGRMDGRSQYCQWSGYFGGISRAN